MFSHISPRFAQEPADFISRVPAVLVVGNVRPQVKVKVSGLSRPRTRNSLALGPRAGARQDGQTGAAGDRPAGNARHVSALRTLKRYSFRYPSYDGWVGNVQCQTTRLFSLQPDHALPFVAGRIMSRVLRQPPVIAAVSGARQEPEGTRPCSIRS